MKAYKGFGADMMCRGFKYEVGKTYKTDKAVLCECGFHACEHPLDVLGFYAPGYRSEYHEVELGGKIEKEGGNSTKVVATEITVGAKLSIAGLVKAAIDFTMKHIKPEAESDEDFGAASATGHRGAASATGDSGAASATGYSGAASATGRSGAASATGRSGAASATGHRGAASATGYSGAASATGDSGAASATGHRGAASATGHSGAASATGDSGAASATGHSGAASAMNATAVAVSWGPNGRAKGVKGAHIVLSEWKWDGSIYEFVGAKMVRIDDKEFKADTWYTLENGEIKEAK